MIARSVPAGAWTVTGTWNVALDGAADPSSTILEATLSDERVLAFTRHDPSRGGGDLTLMHRSGALARIALDGDLLFGGLTWSQRATEL